MIGSKRKVIARGDRKGLVTSDTDTPQERAEKWTRFQGGEFDVVLLTYSALERTRMNEDAVRDYADQTEAIQREVKLRQRNALQMKNLTERQRAILKEGVSAWVAEVMEIREGWEYDPGIAWDDIGIDLLVVDEAQNFKIGTPRGKSMIHGSCGRRSAAIRRHSCWKRAQCAQIVEGPSTSHKRPARGHARRALVGPIGGAGERAPAAEQAADRRGGRQPGISSGRGGRTFSRNRCSDAPHEA